MPNRIIAMNICLLLLLLVITLAACRTVRADPAPDARASCADAAGVFMKAYPAAGLRMEQGAAGPYLVLDSVKIPLDSSGPSGPSGASGLTGGGMEDETLCAMLEQPYPAGPGGRYPDEGFDPGRARNQTLLTGLYGDSEKTVISNCVKVPFLDSTVFFNARHGAASALARVGTRLEAAAKKNPAIMDYVHPMGGTVNWRVIKGSGRLSAHSFGIAIDLNPVKGVYWLEDPRPTPESVEHARQNFPQEIVDAFEAEGFIWGGKWHAYDLMHFEYRPELFIRP